MKRTFAVIGFSFMLGQVLCNYLLDSRSVYLTVATLALSVIFLSVKKLRIKKELCSFFICLFLSSALFTATRYVVYEPNVSLADTKCEIEATVLDTPAVSSSGNYGYLVKTDMVNGKKKAMRMMLYAPYDISVEPYDKVSFSAYPFIIGSNDKGMYLHFRSRRTYLGAYTQYDVRVFTPNKKPIISVFPLLKSQSIKIITRLLDKEQAGFSIGILFGDKILVDNDLKQDFQRVGLTHIMAVSGLHMSVWVYGLYRILRRLHIYERKASVISILFSLCVVCFSSFSVSVIRSMIMTCVYLSAGLFKRRSDGLNSLGLAVFIMCATNPFVVCDVSFMLSVYSTLGIILASSRLSELKNTVEQTKIKSALDKKPINYLAESLTLSVSAALFTYPIAIGIFGGISTVSPLINLLVIPTLSPCLLMSGILTMFPSLTLLINTVRYFLTLFENYIFFVVKRAADLPFSYFQSQGFILCVALPIIISTALFIYCCKTTRKLNITALSIGASISVIAIFYYI